MGYGERADRILKDYIYLGYYLLLLTVGGEIVLMSSIGFGFQLRCSWLCLLQIKLIVIYDDMSGKSLFPIKGYSGSKSKGYHVGGVENIYFISNIYLNVDIIYYYSVQNLQS